MNKRKLTNFISKYNLNGLCNQVKITCKDDKLLTSFATDQKDLLGFVVAKEVGLPEVTVKFGIFNTPTLLKILGVMQNSIDVSFNEERGKVTSLDLVDDVFTSKVMLAELDIIEDPPSLKETPSVDLSLSISSNEIDWFLKAKSALADSEILAFVPTESGANLVINYAEHNTDTMTIALNAIHCNDEIPIMKFSANLLKEVLSANKDATSGIIELSSAGLMTLIFSGEDFQSKYLLVMLQD